MLIKTKGIVLHHTNYSETSIVAKIYTEKSGLQSFLVNSVRKKKSKFAITSFQPLSLVDIVAYENEKPGLKRLSEIRLSEVFTSIPFDTVKSSVAIFLNEILLRSLREEEANPNLFSFLYNAILILDLRTPDCSLFHSYFLVQLSKYLGFFPSGTYSDATPFFDLYEGKFTSVVPDHQHCLQKDSAELLYHLMISNFENHHAISAGSNHKKEFINELVKFYELHQTHGIQSHKILKEIMQ